MRLGRRGVVITVGTSFVGAAALVAAAALHDAAAFRAVGFHLGVEALLWCGAVAACLAFAWSFGRFRREVRIEKVRREKREVRDELLRRVRDYELARQDPRERSNN